MPATREQARDDVMSRVRDAAVGAGVSATDIVYDDKPASKPSTDAPVRPWLRVLLRHQSSIQTSLTGSLGTARFTRTATLTVQVFTRSGTGLELDDALVPAITGVLEGKVTPRGVLFFDVTANEIGEDGPWFNTNVTARVEYDEFIAT